MIYTPLMEHQQKAFGFVRDRPRAALFMPTGTGKSLVALAWIEHHVAGAVKNGAIPPFLVLVTSDKNGVVNVWPDEIARHTDCASEVRHADPCSLVTRSNPIQYVCANYDWVVARQRHYTMPWFAWIGDESSEFKDQRTRRSHVLRHVLKDTGRKLILNGTPMTERPEDLYGQFLVLDGGAALGSTVMGFRARYMQPNDVTGYGWMPRRSTFSDIRRAVDPIVWWPMPDECPCIPKVKRYVYEVGMTDEQKEVDDKLREDFRLSLQGKVEDLNYAVSVFQKRAQLCGGAIKTEDGFARVFSNKLNLIEELCTNEEYPKVIVWHMYVAETELLSWRLRSADIPLLTYTDPDDPEPLDQFNAWSRGVLLIRLSMGKGLNQLANADLSVFYSNPFSYAMRAQAEGRSRRLTTISESSVYIDLTTKGGVDQVIYRMLMEKRDVALTLSGLRGIARRET